MHRSYITHTPSVFYLLFQIPGSIYLHKSSRIIVEFCCQSGKRKRRRLEKGKQYLTARCDDFTTIFFLSQKLSSSSSMIDQTSEATGSQPVESYATKELHLKTLVQNNEIRPCFSPLRKRIASWNSGEARDFESLDWTSAGKESVRRYTSELDQSLELFLQKFPTYYDYSRQMIALVREQNPQNNSKSNRLVEPEAVGKTLNGERGEGSVEESKLIGNLFPDNSTLLEHLRRLRTTAHELLVIFDSIQDWILVHVPAIKEEDNSGVEVQENVVTQVAGFYKLIKNVYIEETEYLNRRGELETSMLKQPRTVSWRKAIDLQDSQEWDDIEHCWRALVRVVMLCQNLLVQNMAKLREPRSMHRTMHV